MKTLKKFNLLAKTILQEIQTYNDKPGYPGGNNIKHSDAGSITGNCCKEYSTDAGNIGGKTDTCQGLCDQQVQFKYQIGQNIFIYDFSSNIINNEFQNSQNIKEGIIRNRKTYNNMNFYAIQFPNYNVLFNYPQFKLGNSPEEAKENYYQFKYNTQHSIQQDAAVAPAIGTVNVMGPTPGMPSIADTAGGSRSAQKLPTDPGVTTKDISQIYSPSLNKAPKAQKQKKQKFHLFSRFKK